MLPAQYLLGGQRYSIAGVLGSGGFGVTYQAWDRRDNCRVAVKEFFPRHLAARRQGSALMLVHPGMEAEFAHAKLRFQQEAGTLYELRKVREIIDVRCLFEENGTAYYVMELLEGQDMKGLLAARGVMSWEALQQATAMILRALNAVHGRQMIHRDISPDNIFMLRSGGAKLIDFGNARSYMSSSPLTKIVKTRFAPVEQFMDEGRQGPWTDIYSLSVTLYYALSGVLPPPSSERLIGIKTGTGDPVKPLAQMRPDIPRHVADAVTKGMEVLEADRYRTVREMAGRMFPGVCLLEENLVTARHARSPAVQCTGGLLKGKCLILRPGITETMGRGKDVTVLYPADCQGVSRHQCSFMQDNRGTIYVRDDGSSYGTRLNGRQMKPMEWYAVKRGDSVCFAREEYKILG